MATALLTLALTLVPAPMPTPTRAGRITVGEVELAYAAWGPPRGTPVVLLHGGGGTFAHWGGQLEALAKVHPVLALDARGHGKSTRGTAPFSYALMADDLEAALAQLQVDAAHVVGWSDGGIVALELALRHPRRVRSLVLFGVNFDASGTQKGSSAATDAYWARCRKDTADFDGLLALLRPMWRSQPRLQKTQLATITVPALVLRAEKDEIIRPAHAQELAAGLKSGKLVTLEKVGHIAPWEDPKAFSDAVLNFLGGVR